MPRAVRELDDLVSLRPVDTSAFYRIKFIRYAEAGREQLDHGVFDAEWIQILWTYHGTVVALYGPEVHPLRYPNGPRWSETGEYTRALDAATRFCELAGVLEAMWHAGSAYARAPSFFGYIAPSPGMVTTIYYTAAVWLEEVRVVAKLAQGMQSGQSGQSGTHTEMRELALACIASAPTESQDVDHSEASTLTLGTTRTGSSTLSTTKDGGHSLGQKGDAMMGSWRPDTPLMANDLPRGYSGAIQDDLRGGHSPMPGMRELGFPDLLNMSPVPGSQGLYSGSQSNAATVTPVDDPAASYPVELINRAREAVTRFNVHVSLLKRIARHARVAAGCAAALEGLWKSEAAARFVDEGLLR